MTKNDIKTVPVFYQPYIDLAGDKDLMDALPKDGLDLFTNNLDVLHDLGMKTYEVGKWTVNEMLEHIIDTERLFQARALRFARMDKTNLPGYNENDYAQSARSNQLSLEKLIEDFKIVRAASVSLFSNFSDDELNRTGTANGHEISVLALGFILVGHPVHHFKVLEERYFDLV